MVFLTVDHSYSPVLETFLYFEILIVIPGHVRRLHVDEPARLRGLDPLLLGWRPLGQPRRSVRSDQVN